jgi:hypothetical protein
MIGVITFPLLGKIEDRKISVLKFFNMLSVEQIQDLIAKGREFQVEFESMTRANDGLLKGDGEEFKGTGDQALNNDDSASNGPGNMKRGLNLPVTSGMVVYEEDDPTKGKTSKKSFKGA